jgi:uncharacterized membrane protein
MRDCRLQVLCYFLLLAMGVLHWINVYPQLPSVMASHFTANGTPNGWQSKSAFFVFSSIVIAMSAFVSFVVPRFIAKRSDDRINLPHKSYWLAPERREETMRFLSAQMNWFGCGLLFVSLYALSQAINANLPSVGHFDAAGMWYVLGGFLLFVFAWLGLFVRHFYNVPPDQANTVPGSLHK